MREYLQVRLLEGLQSAGASADLVFHGGTALRLLYRTPRFSEDLDFAVLRVDTPFDLVSVLTCVKHELDREGYDVSVSVKTTTPVHKALIRFRGLLYEMGLSPLPDETMLIKLEVDTNPPEHAGITTSRIPRRFGQPVRVVHHDQATLLAGKLSAILTRGWVKGRDVFDLVWYAGNSEWPGESELPECGDRSDWVDGTHGHRGELALARVEALIGGCGLGDRATGRSAFRIAAGRG